MKQFLVSLILYPRKICITQKIKPKKAHKHQKYVHLERENKRRRERERELERVKHKIRIMGETRRALTEAEPQNLVGTPNNNNIEKKEKKSSTK